MPSSLLGRGEISMRDVMSKGRYNQPLKLKGKKGDQLQVHCDNICQLYFSGYKPSQELYHFVVYFFCNSLINISSLECVCSFFHFFIFFFKYKKKEIVYHLNPMC